MVVGDAQYLHLVLLCQCVPVEVKAQGCTSPGDVEQLGFVCGKLYLLHIAVMQLILWLKWAVVVVVSFRVKLMKQT